MERKETFKSEKNTWNQKGRQIDFSSGSTVIVVLKEMVRGCRALLRSGEPAACESSADAAVLGGSGWVGAQWAVQPH